MFSIFAAAFIAIASNGASVYNTDSAFCAIADHAPGLSVCIDTQGNQTIQVLDRVYQGTDPQLKEFMENI